MRIAYISADPGIPLWGDKGAANHVREFVAALVELGHAPTLFVARRGKGEPTLDVPVKRLRGPRNEVELSTEAAREVAALDKNPALAEELRAQHRKSPFALVYERYSLWSFAARDFAAEMGIPYVLEVNSPLRDEQRRYRQITLDSAAAAIQSLLFSTAQLIVGVSDEVVEYVRKTPGSAPAMTVPNGVDLALFRNLHREPARETFTVGFVGSLKPWHGIDILLDAFDSLAAESEAYRLLIVGDGPMRETVERFACAKGLGSRIELTGAVPKAQAVRLMGTIDAAVAPYPNLSGFYFSPLKVFEYMAAGIPVIASDFPVWRELFRDTTAIRWVDPLDTAAIAREVDWLLDHPAEAEAMGENGRQVVLNQLNWRHDAQVLLDAYENVLGVEHPAAQTVAFPAPSPLRRAG